MAKEYLETISQNKPEKKSSNKGISQEAINTLLDLSLTTEEALSKSAEITIREQDKLEKGGDSPMTNESKLTMLDKWLDTKDKAEFLRLGMHLDPQATEMELTELFEKSMSGYPHK